MPHFLAGTSNQSLKAFNSETSDIRLGKSLAPSNWISLQEPPFGKIPVPSSNPHSHRRQQSYKVSGLLQFYIKQPAARVPSCLFLHINKTYFATMAEYLASIYGTEKDK